MTPATIDPERINRLLDWLESSLKGAQDFTLEQAPLVAREIVAWVFWGNLISLIIFAIFGVILIAASCLLLRPVYKAWRDVDNAGIAVGGGLLLVFMPIASLICFIAAASSVSPMVKSCVAPRLVIIDYIRGKS